MKQPGKQYGFTLLEMLVATLIMGIAVIGLMAEITASMRNATRVTNRDRAALLARSKMDELLLDPLFPLNTPVHGALDPSLTGGVEGGWSARLTRFEMPPSPVPGQQSLDRMSLEIWWMTGGERRTFALSGYRAHVLRPEDLQ
ncbi:MAG TPA: prepilin-type N-terminal cleavage/methylation domain-containing protein [Bryobacteraceae bacterium]|nr:prepilin-type N-terminal cleavage/methylation domain-containing protein [Bryobacteraceae bacterium]